MYLLHLWKNKNGDHMDIIFDQFIPSNYKRIKKIWFDLKPILILLCQNSSVQSSFVSINLFVLKLFLSVGPDWHSRLRYISSPRNSAAKPTLPVGLIEQNIHFVRPYPQNWQRSKNQWIYRCTGPRDQKRLLVIIHTKHYLELFKVDYLKIYELNL